MANKKKGFNKKDDSSKPDPVFIPVFYNVYRNGKITLLNAQVKVLECIHTINRIRELQKQKDFLKMELYRHLSEVIKIYYQTQDLLPLITKPNLMKKLERTMEVAINYQDTNSSFSYSKKVSQSDELDVELNEIKEKLNSLNLSTRI